MPARRSRDPRHRRRVRGREQVLARDVGGTGQEEGRGFILRKPAGFDVEWRREQRSNGVEALARHVETFPAGRQHGKGRGCLQQPGGEHGGRLEHVLAVVQDDKHAEAGQIGRNRLVERAACFFVQSEGSSQCALNRREGRGPCADGRQLDKPRSITVRVEGLSGDFQSQARLAASAYAGEREHSAGLEAATHFRHVALAPNKARGRGGQIGIERKRRRGSDLRSSGSLLGEQAPAQSLHIGGRRYSQLIAKRLGQGVEDPQSLRTSPGRRQQTHQAGGRILVAGIAGQCRAQCGLRRREVAIDAGKIGQVQKKRKVTHAEASLLPAVHSSYRSPGRYSPLYSCSAERQASRDRWARAVSADLSNASASSQSAGASPFSTGERMSMSPSMRT